MLSGCRRIGMLFVYDSMVDLILILVGFLFIILVIWLFKLWVICFVFVGFGLFDRLVLGVVIGKFDLWISVRVSGWFGILMVIVLSFVVIWGESVSGL